MATDLFLEMAELPATGSLGTGQLDTRNLLVAGVPISISSKYLYLYLELSGSTIQGPPVNRQNDRHTRLKTLPSQTSFTGGKKSYATYNAMIENVSNLHTSDLQKYCHMRHKIHNLESSRRKFAPSKTYHSQLRRFSPRLAISALVH